MSGILNLCEGNSQLPFLFKNRVSGHTILFDATLVKHVLPFNSNFFHDWWFVFIATNLGSIKLIPESLVKYRRHTNNTVDILNLKENRPNEDKIYNALITDCEWIGHCATYNGSYSAYIEEIYRIISGDISFFRKIRLYILLYRHKKELFAINKNSQKQKF